MYSAVSTQSTWGLLRMAANVRSLMGRSRPPRKGGGPFPPCAGCGTGAPGEHQCQVCSGIACEACAPSSVWLPSWRCAHRVCRACVSVLEWGPPLHNRLMNVGQSLHMLGMAAPAPLKIRHCEFEDVIDFCEGALVPLQDLRTNFDELHETMRDLSHRLSSLLGPPRVEAPGPSELASACVVDAEQIRAKLAEYRVLHDHLRSELVQAEYDLRLERDNHEKLKQQSGARRARRSFVSESRAVTSNSACGSPESSTSPTRSSQNCGTPCDESFGRGAWRHDSDASDAEQSGSPPRRRMTDESSCRSFGVESLAMPVSRQASHERDNTPRGRGPETCALCATVLPKRIIGHHISCAICYMTVCKKCAPHRVEMEGSGHTEKTCRACISVAVASPDFTKRLLLVAYHLYDLASVDQPTTATSLSLTEAIRLCERALVPLAAKKA
eukprot:NODE_9528_length_1417_cov_6.322481.p1 GENE.NODE_9528_length_1417_cov_6.322481~~NODE_9528_length_1417_cov_6.322481.p1  ORF type:complete len:441 (+),score=72.95 NODE_9528_length_1417_cov_6.322481:43-1365(+)